jgi:uncharacterized membrane protein
MEINGVPLHPLIVHAVVVFVPLGALSGLLFATVPRWRWLLRGPTLLLALAAVALTRVAVITGTSLKNDKGFTGTLGDRIATHQTWAHRLEWSVWVFAVVALVAVWVLPYARPLVGREDRVSPMASLVMVATVLLPIAGAAVLVLAVITGDAGAKAVWKTG